MNKTNQKTIRLVTSGVLIALATVLSMIKVFELPYGGSITLFSMVPVMMLGVMYGVKWGLLCGTVNGILQAVLGAATTQAFAGVDGISLVAMVLLDYIIAFAVLGTAGMFKNIMKNKTVAFALGAVAAGLLRFLAHFASGWILWGSYAEGWFGEINNDFSNSILSNFSGQMLSALYSFIYNGMYMLPEIIISVVAVVVLMAIKPLNKQILTAQPK